MFGVAINTSMRYTVCRVHVHGVVIQIINVEGSTKVVIWSMTVTDDTKRVGVDLISGDSPSTGSAQPAAPLDIWGTTHS
jgi:hypothetical protein